VATVSKIIIMNTSYMYVYNMNNYTVVPALFFVLLFRVACVASSAIDVSYSDVSTYVDRYVRLSVLVTRMSLCKNG